jgi:hypothetical protein
MAEDSVLNLIASEFKLWGVKFQHQRSGSGHIELAWQVSPDKEVRKTYLPHTSSDWRSWLNMRSQVRRMFQQDGLSLKKPEKPEPVLRKALSVPKDPPEKPEDQFKAMRAEIADLTNFVLELGGIVSGLCDIIKQQPVMQITAQPSPEPVPIPAFLPPEPMPLKTRAPNTRGSKVIDYLSFNWNSLDAIARDMGLSPIVVKRKLVYLYQKDLVQLDQGRWRKTPPKFPAKKPKGKAPKVAPAILARKQRRNGHSLNGHHS